MFYLYEIQTINQISQYMLTKVEGDGVITVFDAYSDEEAIDIAFIYISKVIGLKKEYGISIIS